MNNKIIISMLVLLTGSSVLAGCSKFEQMNKNNNALQNTNATSFVQPTVFNFEYNLLNQSFSLNSQLMQYTVAFMQTADKISNYRILNNVPAGYWNAIYPMGGNAQAMLDQAERDNSPSDYAVASIIKCMVMSTLTDAFGDVPYFEALRGYTEEKFTPRYDEQQRIYADMFALLEQANTTLGTKGKNFTASEDQMYKGVASKWRKFGNSLYVRLLMRIALKDEAEGSQMGAVAKLAEIYANPQTYPIFENRTDAANVIFSESIAALNTPFYALRAGLWNSNMICDRLMGEMYASGLSDPRLPVYFDKKVGAPTQMTYQELVPFVDIVGHYNRAVIQNRDHFAIMNYSELFFIWAEAAHRGWLPGVSVEDCYKKAVTESINEWVSTPAESYAAFLNNQHVTLTGLAGDAVLNRVLTQKWISNYLVGIESWCDFRRTGYPEMPIKSLAGNDGILPTRLRYPSDEEFRNTTNYFEAINRWLSGVNNMTTNVWWADHSQKRK